MRAYFICPVSTFWFLSCSELSQKLLEIKRWISGETCSLKSHSQLLSKSFYTTVDLNLQSFSNYNSNSSMTSFDKKFNTLLNLKDINWPGMNLMKLNDGGRWKMVGNTCNRNAWSLFTNKLSENLSLSLSLSLCIYVYIYIYTYISHKASLGEYR